VVVVGAGLSGLAAAKALVAAGVSVLVLEARDRPGGRTLSHVLPGGHVIDLGAEATGTGQERLQSLASDVGVPVVSVEPAGSAIAYVAGERVLVQGPVPNEATERAVRRLDAVAAPIDPEAPWSAPQAAEWDATTLREWLEHEVTDREARASISTRIEAWFAVSPHEVSLLHTLFYARTSHGIGYMFGLDGQHNSDRFDGGSQRISTLTAEWLGERVRFSCPVRRLEQDVAGVLVRGERFVVRGRFAIMALSPMLAGRLEYEPPMPALRDQLTQRVSHGSGYKVHAVYDEPFWREQGLSGPGLETCRRWPSTTRLHRPAAPGFLRRSSMWRQAGVSRVHRSPSGESRPFPLWSDTSGLKRRVRTTTSSKTGGASHTHVAT
jgi:monoamine oxidase